MGRSVVTRGIVLLEEDEHGQWQTVEVQAELAIAYHPACKRRFRILPSNVLARKAYSVEVIEFVQRAYAAGRRSLRDIAWSLLGDRELSHTTVHAWSEGLGGHALGLPAGEVPGGAAFNRLIADTKARIPAIRPLLEGEIWVDPKRFRSEERRERLCATNRTLALADAVSTDASPGAFRRWRELALRWSKTCALLFRTGLACTAFGQVGRRAGRPSRPPPTGV